MDKVKAIILFANTWSMTDENTGNLREGMTIEYVMTGDLEPLANEDGSLGYRTIRESVNINNAKKIEKVPGIYDLTFGYSILKGRPVLKVMDIEYVSEVV
jgi:hypothetical protein